MKILEELSISQDLPALLFHQDSRKRWQPELYPPRRGFSGEYDIPKKKELKGVKLGVPQQMAQT